MSHDDEFARASFARFCAARCRGDRRLTTVSGQAARLLRIPRSWSRARFRSVAHSRPYCDVIASIVLIALFLPRFFHFIYSVDNSRPARTFVSFLSFLFLFFFFRRINRAKIIETSSLHRSNNTDDFILSETDDLIVAERENELLRKKKKYRSISPTSRDSFFDSSMM